jgi:hypothetical protein
LGVSSFQFLNVSAWRIEPSGEYEAKHIKVNDMIYTKSQDTWKLDVSYYRNLRIPMSWVRSELSELGFTIGLCENNKGMITVIAGK